MRCSFCWEEAEAGHVVANGTICICHKCIAIGAEIIKEYKERKKGESKCNSE